MRLKKYAATAIVVCALGATAACGSDDTEGTAAEPSTPETSATTESSSPAMDPAADLVARGRVALTGGLPFGTGGAHHARLNFATTPEVLTEAVGRIAASL